MEFEEVELGQISNVTKLAGYEFTNNIKYTNDGDIIAIRALNIKNGKLDLSQVKKITKETSNNLLRSKLYKNDIVLTYTGSKYGEVALINQNEKFHLAPNVCKVTVASNVNPYYIFLIMQTRSFKIQMKNFGVGSSQPTIPMKNIRKLKILLPSLEHQNRIVKVLKPLDEKIDLNYKLVTNLEELSQTLFKRWFVDFEFPDENGNPYKSSGGEMIDSELGEIPKGWKLNKLDKIINIKSGKRPRNKVNIVDNKNKIPIIGASKVMGYTSDYLESEPILVMGRVGTHGVIQRFNNNVWPSDNTFFIKSQFMIYTYFILINIDYKSLNRRSTQPLLSQKDIKNIDIIIPESDTLIVRYEEITNMYFKQIDVLKDQISYLNELRDTLLPKLMSGKIEIPDDIEVNMDELSI